MKTLVKCKLYLMTFLTTVLFTIGTAVSDNQTGLSTGDTTQMPKKPTIMILGSSHLAPSGVDTFNYKMDDVLTPKRQSEIEQLVTQLKAFQPTKIALEAVPSEEAGFNANYQDYLEGIYQLKRGEKDQIGFRLAKEMGHSKLYCVDYFPWPDDHPFFPKGFDWDLIDYRKFAEIHGQEHLLSPPPTKGKITKDKGGITWIEPEEYEPIINMYIRLNQPEWKRSSHQQYLRQARIGLGDAYPGANWMAHSWYDRDLKIYVNLTRITESADDRILLVIGASHIFQIEQFLKDSGDYIVESPLKYLKKEDAIDDTSDETDNHDSR